MNIMIIADSNYLPFVEVLIKSISCYHRGFNIFLVRADKINDDYIKEINNYLSYINAKVWAVEIDHNLLEKFEDNKTTYISNATFLRYYIEFLYSLSPSNEWLYIDVDTIITGRIDDVFLLPEFEQSALLACLDPYVMNLDNYDFVIDDYFNAGVMFINAKNWDNKLKLLNRMTKLLFNKAKFLDQDILNLVFYKQWKVIDKIYNYQNDYMYNRFLLKNHAVASDISEIKPRILHFTGPIKAWSIDDNGNYLHAYGFVFDFYKNLKWEDIIKYPINTFTIDF